jgi:ribose transport system permease protein
LGNISDIFIETSLVSFVAFGQALVISVGAVDMAVGHTASMGAMIASVLMAQSGWPTSMGITAGLLAGGFIGLVNGVLVSRLYINSMIATIGTQFVMIGMLYMITFGRSIMMLPDSFTLIGNGDLFGIPVLVYLMAIAFLLCHLFLEKTVSGRRIHMIGGNIEASRLSGVSIYNITLLAFILCGVLASASGILSASRQSLANVDIGYRFLLASFASAMLGTVIFGGRNTILGTLCGAFFLVILVNGMTILGAGPEWIYFAQGSLLLAAILLNFYTKKLTDRFRT